MTRVSRENTPEWDAANAGDDDYPIDFDAQERGREATEPGGISRHNFTNENEHERKGQDDMTGKEYKELREALGYNRAALAELLGVTERTVYRIEAMDAVPARDAYAIQAIKAAAEAVPNPN